MGADMQCSPFIPGTSFPNEMEGNALALLLESGVRDSCVGQNRLVVPLNASWSLTWDAHHSELAPQPTNVFPTLLHWNKLMTETAAFNAHLFL